MPVEQITKAEFLRRLGPDGPEVVALSDFARHGLGISLSAAYGRLRRGTFPVPVIRTGGGDRARMSVRTDAVRQLLAEGATALT